MWTQIMPPKQGSYEMVSKIVFVEGPIANQKEIY
jgi:hypothetical protein